MSESRAVRVRNLPKRLADDSIVVTVPSKKKCAPVDIPPAEAQKNKEDSAIVDQSKKNKEDSENVDSVEVETEQHEEQHLDDAETYEIPSSSAPVRAKNMEMAAEEIVEDIEQILDEEEALSCVDKKSKAVKPKKSHVADRHPPTATEVSDLDSVEPGSFVLIGHGEMVDCEAINRGKLNVFLLNPKPSYAARLPITGNIDFGLVKDFDGIQTNYYIAGPDVLRDLYKTVRTRISTTISTAINTHVEGRGHNRSGCVRRIYKLKPIEDVEF